MLTPFSYWKEVPAPSPPSPLSPPPMDTLGLLRPVLDISPNCKGVELVPVKSIDELELADVCGYEDFLAVIAELDASPLNVAVVLSDVEGGERALREEELECG